MLGQGRPKTWIPPRAPPASTLRLMYTFWVLNFVLLTGFYAPSASAAESSLRLRIAWGGGAERLWHGSVRISDGSLAEPLALGVEADEPGSIWIADGRVLVQQHSPRAFDGLDLLVSGDADARLSIALAPVGGEEPAAPVEIRLSDLVTESFSSPLDQQGNRLQVSRSPGDRLRVKLTRGSLVFSPGETLNVEAQPHWLGLPAGTNLRLNAQLSGPPGTRPWSQDFDVVAEEPGTPGTAGSMAIVLPDVEGVYELSLAAMNPGAVQRLPWKKPIAERKVQFVVLDPKAPTAEAATFTKITEIDPVNPHWWDRLGTIPLIPGQRKGPLGNGEAARWEHPTLGAFIQLGSGKRNGQVAWEAYPLPLNQPGQPHIVEVEYPGNVPQTLGLSILEPNAAGAVTPISLDSGVVVTDEEADGEARLLKHRIIFWPRTKSPLLLVTNRRDGGRSVYGKIRVLGRRRPASFPRCRWSTRRRGRRNCPVPCPSPSHAIRRASGCWPAISIGRFSMKTSRPTKRSIHQATAAWTTGPRSTRPARAWSNT